MKLQYLIIIFIAIMLPIILVLSQYVGLQIDSLSLKNKYDSALLGATFDMMSAFEINTRNISNSDALGAKIRELEAVISTFSNSLASHIGLNGISNDYILSHVPAIAFCMYDGYYMYLPNDSYGEQQLKPYVYYTKNYKSDRADITIAFSLDNYVSIYGTYQDGGIEKSISEAGYLIVCDENKNEKNGVWVSNNFAYSSSTDSEGNTTYSVVQGEVWYKGYEIKKEKIYENKPSKYNKDVISLNQEEETTDSMIYYYEAYRFTQIYNKIINLLDNSDRAKLLISNTNDPESEESRFMDEKVNVMKDALTSSFNSAVYTYEGATQNEIEMPQLTGEDWDKILNNISVVAFLREIPLNNVTTYNNYVIVNSTTNKQYASPKSIDFIGYDNLNNSNGYYHKITCPEFINGINNNTINNIIGYPSVDFEKYKYSAEGEEGYTYYYKHNEYAGYDCEIGSVDKVNVATIEEYLNNLSSSVSEETKKKILEAYYTAVGRIRFRLVKASSYINMSTSYKEVLGGGAHTVTFDANGGVWQNGVNKIVGEYGRVQTPTTEPQKPGVKFIGWSTDRNAKTATVISNSTIYYNKTDITLYAVYIDAYTIEFWANWKDGQPDQLLASQTKLKGINTTLTVKPPKATGYTFLGWSDDKNDTNAKYQSGELFREDNADGNKKIKLYAIWAEKYVVVTYNARGGELNGIMMSQKVQEGTNYKISDIIPTKKGATFGGWQIGTEIYNSGDIINPLRNITLYAIWNEKNYKLTYDLNGGTSNSDELINGQIFAGFVYISNDKPTKENFDFLGWSKNPNAKQPDEDYNPGSLSMEEENLTLYAVWRDSSVKTYTIIYNANGGQNPPNVQNIEFGIEVTLRKDIPVRVGKWTFLGWSKTSGENNTVDYLAGGTYNNINPSGQDTITLYAVWQNDTLGTYIIEYDANGGYDSPESQRETIGSEVTLNSKIPTRYGGYIFLGWSKTSGENNTVDYLAGGTYSDINNSGANTIRLYAVWRDELEFSYKIIYDANGGQNPPPEQIVTSDREVKLSSQQPTYDDKHTFMGWSEMNDNVPKYLSGGTVSNLNPDKKDTITLYASWSYINEEIPEEATMLELTKENNVIPKETPTKKDYIFLGWYTEKNVTRPLEYYITTNGYKEANIEYLKQKYVISEDVIGREDDFFNYEEHVKELKEYIETLPDDEKDSIVIPTREEYDRDTYNNYHSILFEEQENTKYEYMMDNGLLKSVVDGKYNYELAEYKPGQSVEVPEGETIYLFAAWIGRPVQMILDPNGGKWEGRTYQYTRTELYGQEMVIHYPEKANNDLSDCRKDNQSDAIISKDKTGLMRVKIGLNSTTIKAIWKAIVTFNSNVEDGSVTNMPSNITVEESRNIVLPNEPYRAGYEFKGWSTSQLGTSTLYAPGNPYNVEGHVTMYAIWNKIYTVILDANSGGEPVSGLPFTNREIPKGETIILEKLTREGYEFNGWKESLDSSTIYPAGTNYVIKKDVTLYADWKKIETQN